MARKTKFQDLPLELREIIWKLCMPQRVFELDSPGALDMLRVGRRFKWEPDRKWSHRAPTIAHVCHESRQIALAHGRRIGEQECEELDLKFVPAGFRNLPWFWQTTSVFHVNWSRRVEIEPILLWAASRGIKVSVAARLAYRSMILQNPVFSSDQGLSPEQLQSCMVCVHEQNIFATGDAAREQGLFGMGEEPIQLVDPSDQMSIMRYMDLVDDWDRDSTYDMFIYNAVETINLQTGLQLEVYETEDAWLRRKIRDAIKNGDPDLPPHKERWFKFSSQEGDRVIPMADDIPNRDSPWAKRQLEYMPRLAPRILFRLCLGG